MSQQLDMFESGTYVVYAIDYLDKSLRTFTTRAEAEDYQQSLAEDWCCIEATVLNHVDVDEATFWKVQAVLPEQ